MQMTTRHRGFTLLEVLIALLVFSLGLLGMAGLLIVSVKTNHSAYLRTQASFLRSRCRPHAREHAAQSGRRITTAPIRPAMSTRAPAVSPARAERRRTRQSRMEHAADRPVAERKRRSSRAYRPRASPSARTTPRTALRTQDYATCRSTGASRRSIATPPTRRPSPRLSHGCSAMSRTTVFASRIHRAVCCERSRAAGFSLIELMVAITLGILLSIGIVTPVRRDQQGPTRFRMCSRGCRRPAVTR